MYGDDVTRRNNKITYHKQSNKENCIIRGQLLKVNVENEHNNDDPTTKFKFSLKISFFNLWIRILCKFIYKNQFSDLEYAFKNYIGS